MERIITVVFEDGTERDYYPPHLPINKQNGSTMVMLWEEKEGEIFSLAINTDNIAALEMVTTRDEQPGEVLDLIDQAKAREREDSESDEEGRAE